MSYRVINTTPVWGKPIDNAVDQIVNCASKGAYKTALMADHHLGMAVPIGGVVAYHNAINVHAVGPDISCGNKAVRLNLHIDDIRDDISTIMDDVWKTLSFGVGRKNGEDIDHQLFYDDPAWELSVANELKQLARNQLGTSGAGNHHFIITHDEQGRVWLANHFGSRGLGHKLATHFIKAGGGKDGINVDPVVLSLDTQLGQDYLACMNLAGRYAYAGRDWVCDRIAKMLGAEIVESVHNHHNYAWLETHSGEDLWVVRKGATPAFPGQRGFVGASNSPVLRNI